MGGGASLFAGNRFKTYGSTVNKDDRWQKFLQTFDVAYNHAGKFFVSFNRMDKVAVGDITFKKFCETYDVQLESYNIVKRFFLLEDGDTDNTGEPLIYFQQYVIKIYDFCTMSEDNIVEWMFNLFDVDGGGILCHNEFRELCRCVRGEAAATPGTREHKETAILIKELDRNLDNEVSLEEFFEAVKIAPNMFKALFALRIKLRNDILGEKWWRVASEKRAAKKKKQVPWQVYMTGGTYQRPTAPERVKKITKVNGAARVANAQVRSVTVARKANQEVMRDFRKRSEVKNEKSEGFLSKSKSTKW